MWTQPDDAKIATVLPARPRYGPVVGAPMQPGARVQVVALCDDQGDETRVGDVGRVRYLEYDCGCSQTWPSDPMIGVRFADGRTAEFWAEELMEVAPLDPRRLP